VDLLTVSGGAPMQPSHDKISVHPSLRTLDVFAEQVYIVLVAQV
jgi:hypothetical protein